MTPIIGKNSFTKEPLHEIVEKAILRESNLSGALVNEQGDIFYLHGSTGNYLELTPGELSRNNILKMARSISLPISKIGGLPRSCACLCHCPALPLFGRATSFYEVFDSPV